MKLINVSNAFRRELYEDRRNYLEYVDITLKNGRVLNLVNKDLWEGGISIEDSVSSDNSFDVGAAIINKCTIVINNIYDDFSEYDFTDAKSAVYIGLGLPDGTTERIRKGTFTVDGATYNGSIITLECLDNMSKFDKAYSESSLSYPASLGTIVRDACDRCGVPLQTPHFDHDDFIAQTRPNGESTTFREVVSWAAQIACCFCRCDVYGRLELKWYNQKELERSGLDGGIFDRERNDIYATGDNADGGNFNPWNVGDEYDGGSFEDLKEMHHIYSNYSINISTDDVVITGVRIAEKNKEENQDVITTYQSGTSGYIVSIENNELIKNGAGQTVVGWIGEQLIGFRFRKASTTHVSDPTIEAGDVGYLTDRKENTYPIIISSTKFSTGGSQSTTSSAENPLRNSADRFSLEVKNYVDYRKDIEKERSDREKALEGLQNRIDNSSGLFTTEAIQPDGSTIFYMHDKPTLGESKIVWKMTAEAWAVSTDGGKSYNGGMTVDGDTIVRILTATGVNADWVKTGALRVEKNGKTMVNMDFDSGRVDIVANSFSLSSGQTIESIAQSEADKKVSNFISAIYDPEIAQLQAQIDGQIETWYYDYQPALNNIPASSWTTEVERKKHEGDMFYWKSKGYSYRFLKDGNTWKWQIITDSDITKALSDAAKAQDTADGKRRVFVSQPVPPYDVGDLWTQGAGGDIMTCITTRASGNYVASDWQKRNKYIDQAAANTAASNAVDAQTQLSIFNKLTNNGQTQGIYIQDGKLYINADYIQSGTISASLILGGILKVGGRDSASGKIEGYNSSGEKIYDVDEYGIGLNAKKILSNDKIFISLKPNLYGAMFVGEEEKGIGNAVIIEPSALTVKNDEWNATSGSTTFHNKACINYDEINVYGSDLSYTKITPYEVVCSGAKSRLATTQNYGQRLLYCYEMPSPMFGDIGEGETDETGECYIYLDDIFSETVSTGIEYQAFLQKEGQGDIWVSEKMPFYFIVKGDPGVKFAWEVKAKQKDYEYEHLESRFPEEESAKEIDYEKQYIAEMNSIIAEREGIYETA